MTDDPLSVALNEGRTTMSEAESKRLLANYGLDVPKFEVVSSVDDAAAAADTIGTPVVVKVASADVVHKSEWGDGVGVQTGIRSPDEAAAAAHSIFEAGEKRDMDVSVLVEASVDLTAGTEIIVGGSRDPSFGPTVLVGLGGVFTEVYEDTANRLAPLTTAEARDAIDELRAVTLLEGYRDRPPADIGALADAIVAVGELLEEDEAIAEIDVNPVYASPDGVVALDAHIALRQ